jgi:hypothetical protein
MKLEQIAKCITETLHPPIILGVVWAFIIYSDLWSFCVRTTNYELDRHDVRSSTAFPELYISIAHLRSCIDKYGWVHTSSPRRPQFQWHDRVAAFTPYGYYCRHAAELEAALRRTYTTWHNWVVSFVRIKWLVNLGKIDKRFAALTASLESCLRLCSAFWVMVASLAKRTIHTPKTIGTSPLHNGPGTLCCIVVGRVFHLQQAFARRSVASTKLATASPYSGNQGSDSDSTQRLLVACTAARFFACRRRLARACRGTHASWRVRKGDSDRESVSLQPARQIPRVTARASNCVQEWVAPSTRTSGTFIDRCQRRAHISCSGITVAEVPNSADFSGNINRLRQWISCGDC